MASRIFYINKILKNTPGKRLFKKVEGALLKTLLINFYFLYDIRS